MKSLSLWTIIILCPENTFLTILLFSDFDNGKNMINHTNKIMMIIVNWNGEKFFEFSILNQDHFERLKLGREM
jgi:hypothetical protein